MSLLMHVLPERVNSATVNMAEDELLLNHYPDADAVVFRHYGWTPKAVTFGYGQSYAWVMDNLPEQGLEAVRRATGGGIVDHRNDWTYSLVVHAAHPMHRVPADHLYRAVHQAIATALAARGQPAEVMPCEAAESCNDSKAAVPSLCFVKPETFDTLDPINGRKLAGAAMKRTRRGLLLQGSIDRDACPGVDKWGLFCAAFIRELASTLEARTMHAGWPALPVHAHADAAAKYAGAEWNQRR